jgi:hypothetical protein
MGTHEKRNMWRAQQFSLLLAADHAIMLYMLTCMLYGKSTLSQDVHHRGACLVLKKGYVPGTWQSLLRAMVLTQTTRCRMCITAVSIYYPIEDAFVPESTVTDMIYII